MLVVSGSRVPKYLLSAAVATRMVVLMSMLIVLEIGVVVTTMVTAWNLVVLIERSWVQSFGAVTLLRSMDFVQAMLVVGLSEA